MPARHATYSSPSSPAQGATLPTALRCGRRDLLRCGLLAPLGLGLADWFRCHDAAAALPARAKHCILLWLDGGPSHLETFDLKPQAPVEVRGPFQTIATHVAGIDISELLPQTARVAEHIAVIRSLTSPLGEHGIANHYLLTGYPPTPALEYPSMGAVVARERPGPQALPPYIAVPDFRPQAGAGYLGTACEPFATGGDPAHPDFQVRDLDLFPGVTAQRLARRQRLLADWDRTQQAVESVAPADPGFARAFRLVTSPAAKEAFDLRRESDTVRARYGPRTFGQSCLLARRLVERGVPFVTVLHTGWDTHDNLRLSLRDGYSGARVGVGLVPTFDLGFAALIGDLQERQLLQDTLIVAMGEFGRTPKINTRGGRDHWPRVFSVVMAGGGVRGGQVIGASDRWGESPSEQPVTPADLACTIFELLGIDPHTEYRTPDGRPVAVNRGGTRIAGLF